METFLGLRVAWCHDPKQHDEHSRFNHRTGETTMCPGTDPDEARAWEHERTWSQTYDDDK